MKHLVALLVFVVGLAVPAWCATVFVEAEKFHSDGGWEVVSGPETQAASGLKAFSGAKGAADGVGGQQFRQILLPPSQRSEP